MPRQHGGAIRAVRRCVENGNVTFELISVERKRFHATFNLERPDLLTLGEDSIRTLRSNAGIVDAQLLPEQAAVSFQFYNPFVCGLPAANHDGELLKQLGELMGHAVGDPAQPESTLPAAYTYLGQFIAHDVSRMRITDAGGGGYNFRTPRLDLDSLFDGIDATDTTPAGSVEHRGGLGLGLTAGGSCNRNDLPRAANGEAQIADARNDFNLAIAQFTVMMTRFYWKMLACHGNEADARRATINHFQHVVLYDYLCKVIDPDVYKDVVCNGGPKIIKRAPFLVPLEFALAAFRVGHSMVRDHYSEFAGNLPAELSDLLENTFRGKNLKPITDNENRLLNSWVVNWASLIDLPGFNNPSRAMAIDELMSLGLEKLPSWQFREIMHTDLSMKDPSAVHTPIQLPVQTLLRGRLAGLPCAQMLHAAINCQLPRSAQLPPVLVADDIARVTSPKLEQFLNGAGTGFTTCTPLWFYCLRESALPPPGGLRFGPLTSRIVMETIYTAIAEDPDGILCLGEVAKGFVPDQCLVNAADKFGLREFIDFARKP